MQQITNFHSNIFNSFVRFFRRTSEVENPKSAKEKVTDFFNKTGVYFSNLINKLTNVSQIQPKELALNLYNKSKNALSNLFGKSNSQQNNKASKNDSIFKSIRPQPFDRLFIYFIISFVWSSIIHLIVSIVNFIIKPKNKASQADSKSANANNKTNDKSSNKTNDKSSNNTNDKSSNNTNDKSSNNTNDTISDE